MDPALDERSGAGAGQDDPKPGVRAAGVEQQAVRLAADPQIVVLEGLHCVKHAIRFDADVVLLVASDRPAALDLAASLAPDIVGRLEADLVAADASTLARVVGGRTRADLIGFARRPSRGGVQRGGAARRETPTVLLENPRHLGNLGAVVRVAAGFGASAVLSTGSVDPWHPAVVRASAGLHFATSVERVAAGDPVPAAAGPLLAFDPSGEDLREIVIPDSAVLAFGSERHGLSATLRGRADRMVAIPMLERVSSYNLATAVAVGLYHWSGGATGRSRVP